MAAFLFTYPKMVLDDFKAMPLSRFLGQVDYQDASKVINGCAVKAQNMRYSADAAGTRYGRLTTMARAAESASITGLDSLEVEGNQNPGQIPILFDDAGTLLEESPVGSGILVPITPPIGLPTGARMLTTQPANSLIMAFTDGDVGLTPPLQLYGPTGNVDTVSQNRPGMPWTAGTYVQVGDLVRAADGRWWRCTSPGVMGSAEPAWPVDGYFVGGTSGGVFAPISGASATGITFQQDEPLVTWHPPTGGSSWFVALTKVVAGQEVSESSIFGPFTIRVTQQDRFIKPGVELTVYTYNTIQVTIPADPGNSYNIYIGNSSGALNLKENIAATGAAQSITLEDFRTFSVTPGPQPATPTPGASSAAWLPAIAVAADGTEWEEWTPACTDVLPVPQKPILSVNAGGGSIAAGQDVYVRIAFDSLAEGPWSDPAIAVNTPASAAVQLEFGSGTGATPVGGVSYISIAGNVVTVVGSGAAGTNVGDTVALTGIQNAAFLEGVHLVVASRGATPPPSGIPADLPYFTAAFAHANYATQSDSATVSLITGIQGGPRVPTWLSMLLRRMDLFFGVNYNLYAASVATGAAAPVTYALIGTFGMGQAPLITAIPGPTIAPTTTQRLGQIALISDYATTPSGLPNYFSGESGIRFVAVLRKSRTGSLTPIEPSAVFAAQFNNAGAQPVMFFPPPGPAIGESVAALTVVGGSQAGPFTYIQDQDPANPPSIGISALSRLANVVSAILEDATGVEAGQVVSLVDTTPGDLGGGGISTFLGEFVLATVNIGTRTVTWAQTAADATVGAGLLSGATLSVQPTLPTVADVATIAIPLNFDDEFLTSAEDVTDQLTAIGAPDASDAYFVPSLRMVAYVDNTNFPGSFLFSNEDDPANITGDSQDPNNPGSGILSIEDGASRPAICVREMADGEILALKPNGGYRINPSANFPSQWNVVRRWSHYGPVNASAVANGKDFLAFWSGDNGPQAYIQGTGLEWIGKEIQGTLKRLNRNALNTIWAAVDQTEYELKFGVPLDGATTPNYELVCNYLQGWGFPEVLNRYGKLIASRDARRWSINPINARTAKAVKRTLINPPDERVRSRQFLYGMTAMPQAASTYPVISASRDSGIVTITIAASSVQTGSLASVIVGGLDDDSFNGTFAGATWTPIAGGIQISYAQPNTPDAFSAGGTVSTTNSEVTVKMTVPERYDDDGVGIEWIYQPWYTQNLPDVLSFGGFRGQIKGNGRITIMPVTDDPAYQALPLNLLLDGSGVPQRFERGLRLVNETASTVISGDGKPGTWGELHELTMYAAPKFPGRRAS